MPSGRGCTRYSIRTPNWLPSPSRRSKSGRVLGRRDQQDVADARQHQRRERVVDHRLVVDRQQLLRDGAASPGAAASRSHPRAGSPSSLVSPPSFEPHSDGRRISRAEPLTRPRIALGEDRPPPALVVEVPRDGRRECRRRSRSGAPSRARCGLSRRRSHSADRGRGDRRRSVFRSVVAVDAPRAQGRDCASRGPELLEGRADRIDDLRGSSARCRRRRRTARRARRPRARARCRRSGPRRRSSRGCSPPSP